MQLVKIWCRRPDLNWYGSHLPQDFKSCASADSATPANKKIMEAPPRIELGVELLQSSALPLGYGADIVGAEDGNRTRDPRLGKAMLYR
jgi:hypothetical protein